MDKRVKRVNKLISEIARGKIKALDKLFVEFGGLLFIIARKYLFEKELANEVVGDVLLKLVKTSKQFDPKRNGLNWLFKTVKNTAINLNIKNGHHKNEDIDECFDISNIFDEDDLVDNIAIKAAIDKLDEREKKILELKFWQGLTVREIATETGMSLGSTQRLINAVYKKMKLALSDK